MILPSYSCTCNAIHTSICSMELLMIAFVLDWKEQDKSQHYPGSKTETSSRWRQPNPVALDAVGARNFNKELFLITFFSRETLLLITASLSCNEVQVFQDGLERYSQLIKVDYAPRWVFSPYLLKARC